MNITTTRRISHDSPCFIIAEAGVNHNGDVEAAMQLIDVAVASGADAVKFQTFTAERVVTADAPKAAYQIATTGAIESQLEMLQALELSDETHRRLQAHAQSKGILFLSTPFDEASADFLDLLGVPAFKIPSGELTNLPLLAHLASKRKPLIVSTGMASLKEVGLAVEVLTTAGATEMVLLHCVSAYPADPADVNLNAMATLRNAFGYAVGFSDHTLGIEVPLAAVAMGACVIEKHFTLSRTLPGPDHRASLEPAELAALVTGIRVVEAAKGTGIKAPAAAEADVAVVSRKSIVAAREIAAGAMVTREALIMKQPATGLPPLMLDQVVGRTALRRIAADTVLTWDLLGEASR